MSTSTSPRRSLIVRAVGSGAIVWFVVIVMFVVAVVFANGFATPANLNNVTRQGAALALFALAQYLVVLIGHVDLAIAANAKLSAIIAAIVMDGSDQNLLLGLGAALVVGALVGALSTVLVVNFGVESFIATLGVGTIVQGIALFIAPVPTGKASPALGIFYSLQLPGGLYAIVLAVAVVWIVAWFVLRRTVWGRRTFAVGGDVAVAALSGIRVRPVQVGSFLASGVLGSIAGVLLLAGSGVGDPNAANGMEFTALAIVVIGGASLAGGRGRLIGLLGGVALFALLGNVFNLLHIEVWYQQLLRGLIILLAAALFVNKVARPRRARPRPAAPTDSPTPVPTNERQ